MIDAPCSRKGFLAFGLCTLAASLVGCSEDPGISTRAEGGMSSAGSAGNSGKRRDWRQQRERRKRRERWWRRDRGRRHGRALHRRPRCGLLARGQRRSYTHARDHRCRDQRGRGRRARHRRRPDRPQSRGRVDVDGLPHPQGWRPGREGRVRPGTSSVRDPLPDPAPRDRPGVPVTLPQHISRTCCIPHHPAGCERGGLYGPAAVC